MYSIEKHLFQNPHCISRGIDRMSSNPLIIVNLIVIPSLAVSFVNECLTLNVLSPKKCIFVYPSFSTWRKQYVLSHPVGKQSNEICPPFINRIQWWATNWIGQSNIRELFMNFLDESFTDFMFFVVFFISVTFVRRSVTADWRNINHSSSKFNERSSTDYKEQELVYRLTGIFKSAI